MTDNGNGTDKAWQPMVSETWFDPYISRIAAQLWYWRHRLQKRHRPGIFLHSLFRSGSTYLFNTFRNQQGFWCYYEPLHHQLIELRKDKLDIFQFDRKSTDRMSHPPLSRSHFHEFGVVLDNNYLPFFDIRMSYDEFASVRQHEKLYKHIMTLLLRTPQDMIPLLQFNRTSLRIGWCRKFFGNSLHIYLLRNPRDQFESYCRQRDEYNIFLAINLYIIAANRRYKRFAEAYSFFQDRFRVTGDVYGDLNRLSGLSPEIDRKIHYRIFLHLWLASLVEAAKHADVILDMDRLSGSSDYRDDIIRIIGKKFPIPSGLFADCVLKQYHSFSLDEQSLRETEQQVRELYQRELCGLEELCPF